MKSAAATGAAVSMGSAVAAQNGEDDELDEGSGGSESDDNESAGNESDDG